MQSIGPKVAGVWFGDNERALITTLISISHVIGNLVGVVFPIFFVTDSDKTNPETAKEHIWTYILFQSIAVSVMTIPTFLLIKNQPAHPPSRSARIARKRKSKNQLISLRKLLAMRNFWILAFGFSFIMTIFIGNIFMFKNFN